MVYSPHGPDVLRDYEQRFEAAHPEIDFQFYDAGAQEVFTRVMNEKSRPHCDVWWGGPSTMFMQAAEAGLLEPYTPTWADAVDAEYKDLENKWIGTYKSPLCILYNNRHYEPEDVPQTWDDLLDPKWKNKITLRKPHRSGTLRTFIGAMIMRAPSEDEGIAWLSKFHENTKDYMENPQLLYDHVKRNPELISVWLMPDLALQRDRHGYPFAWIIPEDTPLLTEGIAIVSGAPNPAGAKLVYDFVTTPDALIHQGEAYAKTPARADIDSAQLPAWMTNQTWKPMNIDWKSFAANQDRWFDRWDREVFSGP
ncbi:MAG: iron ABC transporter substrate-binding protein [Candidatus Hydrogenedentota bacterium]